MMQIYLNGKWIPQGNVDRAIKDYGIWHSKHLIRTAKGPNELQDIISAIIGCTSHRNFELKNVDSKTKVFTNASGKTFRTFEIFFKKMETESTEAWTLVSAYPKVMLSFYVTDKDIFEAIKELLRYKKVIQKKLYNSDPDCGKTQAESRKLRAERIPHLYINNWEGTISPINCDTCL